MLLLHRRDACATGLVNFFRKTADGFYPLTAICFFYGKLKTENGVFTMPKCTVCHHPQLLEINQAILSKDFTLAVLSQQVRPTPLVPAAP